MEKDYIGRNKDYIGYKKEDHALGDFFLTLKQYKWRILLK